MNGQISKMGLFGHLSYETAIQAGMSQRRIAKMILVYGAYLMKEDESFLTCPALEKKMCLKYCRMSQTAVFKDEEISIKPVMNK